MPANAAFQTVSSVAPRFSLFRIFLSGRDRETPRLDPDSLPEHLKRDLGFSDGPPYARRDPLRD